MWFASLAWKLFDLSISSCFLFLFSWLLRRECESDTLMMAMMTVMLLSSERET